MSGNDVWLCSDEEVPVIFKNLPQTIISTVFVVILLIPSFRFFIQLDICTCHLCLWCSTKYEEFRERLYSPRSSKIPSKFDFSATNSSGNSSGSANHSHSANTSPPTSPRLTRNNTGSRSSHMIQSEKTQRRYHLAFASMIIITVSLCFFTALGKLLCYINFSPVITRLISIFGIVAFYLLMGLSMVIIFMLRLKQTFEGTNLEVTKKSFIIIVTATAFVPILSIIGIIFYALEWSPFFVFGIEFIADILYCIISLLLLRMFVKRLKTVKCIKS